MQPVAYGLMMAAMGGLAGASVVGHLSRRQIERVRHDFGFDEVRLQRLRIEDGDLVMMKVPRALPQEQVSRYCEAISAHLKGIAVDNVLVWLMFDDVELEQVDEEAMRRAGWVRMTDPQNIESVRSDLIQILASLEQR